jgi:SAM-dependent methyltransferase
LSAATCPACGGALVPWRDVPAGEPADPTRFALSRCVACGTAVTGGDPPGREHYTAGVYAPRPPRLRPLVRALQRVTVGQPVRELERAGLPPHSRVLDVGAGQGRLVAELARRGHDARGIEPSERSAELAARVGRPVTVAAIEEHTEEALDAAVLWHVAEHLEDPAAALTRVAGWLRPGGLVLVAVPNIASLQAQIGGLGWLHLDAPRHRLHLTPRGLEALVGRAGLTPVRWSHSIWEHNPAGMWMALLARAGMTPGLPFHLLKRNARPTPRDLALLAAGVPLAPVALALEAAAAAARRGGTVAVVAGVARRG